MPTTSDDYPEGFNHQPRAITRFLHESLLAQGRIYHENPEAILPPVLEGAPASETQAAPELERSPSTP